MLCILCLSGLFKVSSCVSHARLAALRTLSVSLLSISHFAVVLLGIHGHIGKLTYVSVVQHYTEDIPS